MLRIDLRGFRRDSRVGLGLPGKRFDVLDLAGERMPGSRHAQKQQLVVAVVGVMRALKAGLRVLAELLRIGNRRTFSCGHDTPRNWTELAYCFRTLVAIMRPSRGLFERAEPASRTSTY